MTVFNCGDEISKYHHDKVTLREPQQNDMRERRNNGRERLNKGLDEAGHPRPRMIHSQGSYRMWTMIKDSDCDYDIDDGVYFRLDGLKDTGGENLTPLKARCRICDALTRDQRFANPAEVHDNCVRQKYQAGYHIDMPVYRIQTENPGTESEREVYELASKDTWELSDARSVTKWFNDKVSELNSESDDNGHQLRRVVRLTKAFARSRNEWKDRTTSGITMSRLIVDEFCAVASRDDETLLQAWKNIDARLKTSTEVEHPINPALLAEDGNENVRFFQEKLAEALETLTVLEQNCTRNEAREAWDSVFNTDYFSNLPDPSDPSDGTKAVFIATESKTDTRDDGNGRYGRGSKT
jgi:hypothetical protein